MTGWFLIGLGLAVLTLATLVSSARVKLRRGRPRTWFVAAAVGLSLGLVWASVVLATHTVITSSDHTDSGTNGFKGVPVVPAAR